MSRTKRNPQGRYGTEEGKIPLDAPLWAEKHSGNKRKWLRKKKIAARRKARHNLNKDLKSEEMQE